MTLLERIEGPADLRGLDRDQLTQLCREIRDYTVDAVQKTGGHISSSLGATELTVALHRVFDSPNDKLVWDTGHQGYVHKLLTGRRERFATLRQFGGISGFLARSESEHDQFGAGHAGTSISAAQGMAVARDLKGGHEHVVAIIGDGALTAGMAWEALNDIGARRTRMIVVLNDNGMSIAPNVGAVSRMLQAVRTASPYRELKHVARSILEHMPAGDLAEEARRRLFTSLKAIFIPNILFEQHAVTFAAGMATQGIVPIVAIYSTFLQRGFDQVVHDVAIQELPVVFAMDRGGIVGDDGRTHQGLFDIAYLRPLPGIVLMAPKDQAELRLMVWTAVKYAQTGGGPIAFPHPRGARAAPPPHRPLQLPPIGARVAARDARD